MTQEAPDTPAGESEAGPTEDPGPSTEATAAPSLSAVILAAGQGTRMRSRHAKVLHRISGRTLIGHVLELDRRAGAVSPVVVLGHLAEEVRSALPPGTRTVVQEQQLGTGHAVQAAASLFQADGAQRLLVHYGDVALVRPDSVARLVASPVGPGVPLALFTARVPDPSGYGRVLRAADGSVGAIVEEREASAKQRQVNEVFSGLMLLWTPWLLSALKLIPRQSNGEYYLTDLVNLARSEGKRVLASEASEPEEAWGVNDRVQLADAQALLWRRKRSELMRSGVTLLDPATTYVDPDVAVGADTVLHPGCHLRGRTVIGSDCEIGPDAEIVDSQVGAGSHVWRSVLESARVAEDVSIGPFSHLRPGAVVERAAKLGNFAEVKASRIGPGTQMHHFSYVGDADLGAHVNVGAGVVTVNFDGERKWPTKVGDNAFIGSDTMLVAPVEMGEGSASAAGAVVTHNVEPGQLVVGVPARPRQRSNPQDTQGEERGSRSRD